MPQFHIDKGFPKPSDIDYEEFNNRVNYYKRMSYDISNRARREVESIAKSTIKALDEQHKAMQGKSDLDIIKDSQMFDVYEVKPKVEDKPTISNRVTNKEVVATMVTTFFDNELADNQLSALKSLIDGLNYTEKDQFLRELFNSCMDKLKVNNRMPIINFNRLMVKIVDGY